MVGPVSCACDLCSLRGPHTERVSTLGLMFYCWYVEIVNKFLMRGSHFPFTLGLANCVASSAW